jgi:hypothetical protein
MTNDALRARVREARTLLVRRGINAAAEVDRLLGEILEELEARPGRETVEAKARRYLAEGRLEVVLVADDEIEAHLPGRRRRLPPRLARLLALLLPRP